MTDDLQKVQGIKSYLRRTRTAEDLQILADQIFLNASEEVVITSTSADGGSAMGQISFPKWLMLGVVEELLVEMGITPATARKMSVVPDFSAAISCT